jgi:adenylylsulfate kinase-like enzyme
MSQNSSTSISTLSPFITRKQLAERWHVSMPFLEHFKDLPFTKIRRNTQALYKITDVQAYERKQKFNPAKSSFSQDLLARVA